MSIEDYLERERASEIRYEYVNGYVIPKDGVESGEGGTVRAMSGASPAHNRIAFNVCARIDQATAERSCEVYISDIRVRVSDTQFRYPDVAALCGTAQFDNHNPPCLLNPSLLMEVLSPSTEHTDRYEKFEEYRQIPTLTDYVLVAQGRLFVTHYARQSATQWLITDYMQSEDVLTFESLGVSLSLAEIYRRIVFPAPA